MSDAPKPKPPTTPARPVKSYEPPKWRPLLHHPGLKALRSSMYGKHPGPYPDNKRPEFNLPIHRTEAEYPNCATCDGGGCMDCTDSAY